jgi:hypothetical protein
MRNFCAARPLGFCCWGACGFMSGFVERMLTDFMSDSFLGLHRYGQSALRGSYGEGDERMIETG